MCVFRYYTILSLRYMPFLSLFTYVHRFCKGSMWNMFWLHFALNIASFMQALFSAIKLGHYNHN